MRISAAKTHKKRPHKCSPGVLRDGLRGLIHVIDQMHRKHGWNEDPESVRMGGVLLEAQALCQQQVNEIPDGQRTPQVEGVHCVHCDSAGERPLFAEKFWVFFRGQLLTSYWMISFLLAG